MPVVCLDLAKDGLPVCGEILFSYGDEFDDASVGRNAKRFGHERLGDCGIAFIGCGLDLRWESSKGECIGRVKGATEHQAGGMRNVYHNMGLGP